jgi:hypothetical protein
MTLVKSVHIGAVVHNDCTLKTFMQSSKIKLLYEINIWFFDYFRANKLPVYQLPPLDDWTRSHDDPSYWHIDLYNNWSIWIRTDTVEF